MLIEATFTGTNSLGYENGKSYELQLEPKSMSIARPDGFGEYEYESLYSFMKNWDKITVKSSNKN